MRTKGSSLLLSIITIAFLSVFFTLVTSYVKNSLITTRQFSVSEGEYRNITSTVECMLNEVTRYRSHSPDLIKAFCPDYQDVRFVALSGTRDLGGYDTVIKSIRVTTDIPSNIRRSLEATIRDDCIAYFDSTAPANTTDTGNNENLTTDAVTPVAFWDVVGSNEDYDGPGSASQDIPLYPQDFTSDVIAGSGAYASIPANTTLIFFPQYVIGVGTAGSPATIQAGKIIMPIGVRYKGTGTLTIKATNGDLNLQGAVIFVDGNDVVVRSEGGGDVIGDKATLIRTFSAGADITVSTTGTGLIALSNSCVSASGNLTITQGP